ncbi:MAG: hypothetical protein IPM92_10215 [Saprospiraceae bacterium]|nr:hypothetical protein [Saprospiraceae bacterium]
MEPLQENFDLQEEIIQYLNGELSAEAKLDFESRVKNDDVLANELQNYRNIMNGIEHWGESNLRAFIAQVDRDLEQQQFFTATIPAAKPKLISFFSENRKFAMAAVFIGIVLFAFLLVYLNKESGKNSNLYAEFYQADANTTQTVLSQLDPYGFIPSNVPIDSIQWALENYQQGNYKASLSVFERCTNEEGIQNLCKYYVALNYLGLDDANKATSILNDLCASPNHELKTGACWYLALTLIKLDKEDSRIPTLLHEVRADRDSPFSRDAEKLLAQWIN